MAHLNRATLIGRVTHDPEPPKTLPNSGTRVIRLRFAVGRSRKDPQTGNWVNDPNPLFIDCEAFSRDDARRDLVALIDQHVKKGSQLYLEGRLQLDSWDDKKTGEKRSKIKLVIDNLEFLGDKPEGGGGQQPARAAGVRSAEARPEDAGPGEDLGADVPF
jgi:single-strand DNA-binding protein